MAYGDWFGDLGASQGFDLQKAVAKIKANPYDSGFHGMPIWEAGSYYDNGFWITPKHDGHTFDSAGNAEAGPIIGYRITEDLGNGPSTSLLGGASAQYENVPYLEISPDGQITGQNKWQNMGLDKFTKEGQKFIIAMMSMGVGSAVSGAASAAASAGSGSTSGAVGSGAGFVGEGAASGIGAWDAALANSPAWTAGGSGVGGAVFNAAKDSQAANAAIEAAGGDALSAYTSAGIPSTTIANLQSQPGLWEAVKQNISPTTLKSMLSTGSSIMDIAGVLAPLIGGAIGANAAGDAADAQLQAQREAQALMEPFRQGGVNALTRQLELLGIGGNSNASDYGSLARSFTNEDFVKDPGYEFRLQEGRRAREQSAASRGGYFSGATGKALERYGQDYGSNEFTNAYNRFNKNRDAILNPLQSLSGQGQTSSGTMAGYASSAGDAKAAGEIGRANAFTDSLGQAYNNWRANENRGLENAFMERLLTRSYA
jgi:hypothetical protein